MQGAKSDAVMEQQGVQARINYALAQHYEKQRDHPKCIEHYRATLVNDPSHKEVLHPTQPAFMNSYFAM